MAKDFSKVKTDNIYGQQIAEATQEAPATKKRGRPAKNLPRLNAAYTHENYEYLTIMSAAAGMSITEFINKIIADHRENHDAAYKKAIKFTKDFNKEGLFNS